MVKIKEINHQIHLLFQQHGIKSLTMDDLAEKLGCSKKTLYVYYKNRADLVSKVITQDMDDHYDDIQSIIDQNLNPIDEFFSLNQVDLKKIKTIHPSAQYDLKKYYPEAWKVFDLVIKQRGFDLTLNNLKKGIDCGFYRSEINPEIMARILSEKLELIFNGDLFQSHLISFPQVYQELMTHYMLGVVSKKGRTYFLNHHSNIFLNHE
ncbi:MAG: TetR/AcrR family transcriptional regulator [Flavobacteriales bacterium]|nr:TetR/AcrR family transcriptional regulator [Flavobacteriales bacterium]